MSYRQFDDEDGKDKALAVSAVPVGRQTQLRNAFREWLDASKAWSTLRQAIDSDGNGSNARRELRILERRLNAAADAFNQAQQQIGDAPLRPMEAGDEKNAVAGAVEAAQPRPSNRR